MKVFIFAIGGTGSRVLRSLTMLMAAGVKGLNNTTQIYPLIIDYDKENGDRERTLQCLNNYSAVHELVYSDHRDANGAFGCPLYQMKGHLRGSNSSFVFEHNHISEGGKYSDIINFDDLDGEKTPTKILIESLYNTDIDEEHAELHIDTDVGFKGNPNIGSVILHDIENTITFNDFKSHFKQGDRIIIVGSIFGGTGSSGIPVLVRLLRNNTTDAIKNAPISVVLVTPYFNVKTPDVEDKKEGIIDSRLFNSKTKAALNYYKDEINDKISSIYYVGDRVVSQLSHNIGRAKQKNPANIVELLSAMSIVHFISRPDPVISKDESNGENEWKFAMPTKVDLSTQKELSIKDFDVVTRDIFFNYLTALAYSMKYVDECVIENPSDISSTPFYKLLQLDEIADERKAGKTSNDIAVGTSYKGLMHTLEELEKFYTIFKDWVKEIGDDANGHKLNLFKFDEDFYRLIHGDEKSKEVRILGLKRIEALLKKSDFDREINVEFKDFIDPKVKNTLKDNSLQYMFMTSLFEGCKTLAGIVK